MEKRVSKTALTCFYTLILALSSFYVLIFISMRPFWYFINRDTKTPIIPTFPFTLLIFVIYFCFFLYTLILLLFYLNKDPHRLQRTLIINLFLSATLATLLSMFLYYLYYRMDGDQYLVVNYLHTLQPYLIITILISSLIFIHPKSKYRKFHLLYYTSIVILLVIFLLNTFNYGKIKITSGPSLQRIDENHIAIQWTTNFNGTGFVDYGVEEKSLQKTYTANDGLICANTKTHKVVVPCKTGTSIYYKVTSTKINHYFQNNAFFGNSISSSLTRFIDPTKKKLLSFYVLNDVHENIEIYEKYLQKSDYDLVFLNGDTLNSVDNSTEIIDRMMKPLAKATKGSKQFYFVRGNHETRGGEARNLTNYLSLPKGRYYYTFKAGPVFGIVLDTCEDKPDDHEEYSGLVDFEKYRQEQTKWLDAVIQSKDYRNANYRIAFTHIPLLDTKSSSAKTSLTAIYRKWLSKLDTMKVDVIFSGHTHVPEVIQADQIALKCPIIIGGGGGGGNTSKPSTYLAVRAEITENSLNIFYEDLDGNRTKVCEIKK